MSMLSAQLDQPDRAPELEKIRAEVITAMHTQVSRVIRGQTWRRSIETIAKECIAEATEKHGLQNSAISFTQEELRNCVWNGIGDFATEEIDKRMAAAGLKNTNMLPARELELARQQTRAIADDVYVEIGRLFEICLLTDEPSKNRFKIKFALACIQS